MNLDHTVRQIANIRAEVDSLPTLLEDSLALDTALGQLLLTIQEMREAIDDEWREARAARSTSTTLRPMAAATPTLEDLS
jgi:hypothetical protein